MNKIDTHGFGVYDKPPFDLVTPGTKEFVEQKTKRRDELRKKLDDARNDVHDFSLLKNNCLDITAIGQVLNKTRSFSQVHCGRSAMKTSYEEKFQGYPAQSTPVNLMNSVFISIENNAKGLCLTNTETINHLKPCISQLKETVDQLDELKNLTGDKFREKVAQFGADVAMKLDALQTGKELTVPVGPPGCGMFLRIVRLNGNEFNLFIYNGGLDPKAQQGVTPSTLPLYVFKGVPASKLYYFRHNGKISSPFLTELTAITVRNVSGVDSERVLEYFLPFNEYRATPDTYMENYIRCMRANFSSNKSLKALLLHLCGKDRRAYKRLNMDVRLLTLAAEYNRHENHLDSPDLVKERAQLRIAVDNLLKSVYKYAQQEQDGQPILTLEEAKRLLATAIDVFEGVKKADENASKSQAAETKAVVVEENRTVNRAHAAEAATNFSHPKMTGIVSRDSSKYKPYPQASKSPNELLKGLEELKRYLTVFQLELPIYWGHTDEFTATKLSLDADGFAAVERFIADLPSSGDPYWDIIPKDQMRECLEMLSKIHLSYSRAIAHSESKRPCSFVQQLTLFNLYAVIHRMASRLDSERGSPILSHFSVDTSRFKEALDLDPMDVIDSSHQLKRRRDIERYFSDCAETAEHRDLFKWKKFDLDPRDADKKLYEWLLQDHDVQGYMCESDYKECINKWAGKNANEDDTTQIQLRLLNLDMGRVEITGLDESSTEKYKYRPHNRESSKFFVNYRVKQNGYWDYYSTQLVSVLDRKYPHIAMLKQCSIAASVLLDVNAVETPKPSAKDILGQPLNTPEIGISNKYASVASELMLERVEVKTGDEKNEFELQFYGRKLKSVESEGKKTDFSRQFTSTQLSDAAKKAVNSSVETGMYEVYPSSLELRQNEILSKIGALSSNPQLPVLQLAEQVASGEIRIHNLLQWMRLNFNRLEDPATRSCLMILLFRPHYDGHSALSVPLLDLLENDPDHLLVQVRKLIDEGIGCFYRAQPYKRPKVEPLTFLLNLAQIIDRNYFEIHKKKINPPLYKTELFDDLFNLNEGAAAFSPEELIDLNICCFLHHFPHALPEEMTDKDLQEAALAYFRLTESGIEAAKHLGSGKLSQVKLGSTQLVNEFLRRYRIRGKEFSQSFATSLKEGLKLSAALELIPPGTPNRPMYVTFSAQEEQQQLAIEAVPIFIGKDSSGTYEVNLKSGIVKHNGNRIGLSDTGPKINKLWTHILQDRTHQYHKAEDILNFEDPVYKTMRYFNGSNPFNSYLQRFYEGNWYTAVEPDSKSLEKIVPKSLRSGYSHWILTAPQNKKQGPAVLVCDLKTGKPVYTQTVDGIFQKTDGQAQATAFWKMGKSHFNRLAGENWYMGMVSNQNQNEATQIFFPQIYAGDTPVSFQMRGGRWIYNPDPSYVLADPQMDRIFPHHNQYLLLEKILLGKPTGEQRLLMVQPPLIHLEENILSGAYNSNICINMPEADPWQRSKEHMRVRSYQVVNGELCGNTAEDTLYLVWQYLAGKNYSGAIALLRTLGTSDTLTKEGIELIHALFKCEGRVEDYSPEACAVRFEALWLARALDPEFMQPMKNSAKGHRSVEEVFAGYLQGLERMPAELALSARELSDLHNQFNIGPVPTESILFETGMSPQRGHVKTWKNSTKRFPAFQSSMPSEKENYGSALFGFKKKIESLFFHNHNTGDSCAPVFGETELSVHQFYALYEQLSSKELSAEERDEIAFHLYHCPAVESHGFSEYKTYGATIGRLNILNCLYNDPDYTNAPPLPKENNHEKWLDWMNALKKHLVINSSSNCDEIPPPLAGISSTQERAQKVVTMEKEGKVTPIEVKVDSGAVELPKEIPQIKTDLALEKLIQKHFTVEYPIESQNKPLEPLKNLDKLSKKEEVYSEAIDKEFKLYHDDVLTARNQVKNQPQFKLNTKQEMLIADVGAFLDQKNGLESTLLQREYEIINLLMAPRAAGSKSELVAFARQESPMIRTPRMIDIVRACVKGTPEAYKKLNPYLSKEAIEEIHQQTLEFMLDSSTLQQVKKTHGFLKKWKTNHDKAIELGKEKENHQPQSQKAMESKIKMFNAEADAYWQQAIETLTAVRAYECKTWQEIQDNVYNIFFEYKTEYRIRNKQIQLLRDIMSGQKSNDEFKSNVLFQLIMGGGKTSVILSVLLDLISEEPDRLAVLVLHPTQFDAVLGNVQKYQKDRFNKELVAIDYTRTQLNDLKTVRRLYDRLLTAQKDRNGIAIKSTLPQVLLLELRNIASNLRDKKIPDKDFKIESERLQLLGKMLKLFADKAVFLIDEVDMVLNIIQQLNFPKGKERHLPPERIALTSELFQAIYEKGLMKFGPDDPQIKPEEYIERFIGPLSEASFEKRKVPQEHKNAYLRYVSGKIESELEQKYVFGEGKSASIQGLSFSQEEDVRYLRYLWGDEITSKEAGLQALSKFMITFIIPQILTLEPDRHIGYHSSGNGKVIPFQGRKNPAQTELANPDEAVAASALCALMLGIPKNAIKLLADTMAKVAETQAIVCGDFNVTPEALKFFEMTGVPLGLARRGKDIDKIEKHLRENKKNALEFQANLDMIHVTYRNNFLTSAAYDIPELAKANVTCTGTPQTKDTFERIQNAMLDEGTEGKILEELRRQGAGCKAIVLKSEGGATDNFLKLIENQDCDTSTGKIGALIDAGGILKGVTGQQFAEAYLKHFKDHPERNAMVFFHRYIDPISGEQRGSFAVMRRDLVTGTIDSKPVLINDTTRESLERVNVDADSMFVFFEESKTTGVDFKLSATCRALLTFNPQNQTFRKTSQGALRMRGLWTGQTIDHVIPESHLSFYNNEIPTVDQVLATSLKNQAIDKYKLITRSYIERIRHAPTGKVQKKLIQVAAAGDFNALKDFVEQYGGYLDAQFGDNLLEQFGHLTTHLDTITNLKAVSKSELLKYPSKDNQLKKDLDQALKKVRTQAKKELQSGYLANKMEAPCHLPGFGTQVEVAVDQQSEQQQEQQNELEVNMTVENQNQLDFYNMQQNFTEVKEKSWKNLDDLDGELPNENQGVRCISVYAHLEHNKGRYWKEICYSENFQNPDEPNADAPLLYLTENFAESVKTGETQGALPIFSPAHKKISHLLVALGKDHKLRLVALSNYDFTIWREKISTWQAEGIFKPYWIVNLSGELAAGPGKLVDEMSYQFGDGIHENPSYKKALWHANFFNGNLLYLERNSLMTNEMMRYGGELAAKKRRDFLELRAGKDDTLRRQINASECLNPYSEKLRDGTLRFQSLKQTTIEKSGDVRPIQNPKRSPQIRSLQKKKIEPTVPPSPEAKVEPIVPPPSETIVEPIIPPPPEAKVEPIVPPPPEAKVEPIVPPQPKANVKPIVPPQPKANVKPIVPPQPKAKKEDNVKQEAKAESKDEIKPIESRAVVLGKVVASIFLSVILSQIFGAVKGIIDLIRREKIRTKLTKLKAKISEQGERADLMKEKENLTKTEKVLGVALRADLAALIPFAGAYYYWKIMEESPKDKNT